MRASTLFAITLSLLLGLGAVAGARYAGLFEQKEPPPPEDPITIKVLSAEITLYEGIALMPNMVKAKDLRLSVEEERQYKESPGKFMAKYMPGNPQGVQFRVPRRTIPAGQILMTDMFEDAELPPTAIDRVEEGYRAVNVAVTKANSVGGTLRMNDYVDVWLTTKTTIGSGKEAKTAIASACIAKGCKIVMKRNTLWPVLMADPEGKPINFTLQANPYRSALIEYALNRGDISLRPAPAPAPGSLGIDPSSEEYGYKEEDRIRLAKAGEYTVSDIDLMRIFKITPPAPVPPPPSPITTRRVYGTDMYPPALYDPNGGGPLVPVKSPSGSTAPPPPTGAPPISFSLPGTKKDEECENCGK